MDPSVTHHGSPHTLPTTRTRLVSVSSPSHGVPTDVPTGTDPFALTDQTVTRDILSSLRGGSVETFTVRFPLDLLSPPFLPLRNSVLTHLEIFPNFQYSPFVLGSFITNVYFFTVRPSLSFNVGLYVRSQYRHF